MSSYRRNGLGPADWNEAFAHHPRIGGKQELRERFAATRQWAAGEQAGVSGAPEAVLDALAEGNRDYESRFGHIFIVCATGLTAEVMLEKMERRLTNSADREIRIAADEQAKITQLRLQKLIAGLAGSSGTIASEAPRR